MNILILAGSPRKGGNTDLLVGAFVKGASQKNHVEVVSVHDYKVNPCMGCNACFKNEAYACVQNGILAQYRLCLNFFKLEDAGRVLVRGVKDKGDIRNADALHEAFHLGSNVQ